MHRSRGWSFASLCLVITIAMAIGNGQQGDIPTFGSTVVIPGGLTGKIYHLPVGTLELPNFDKLEAIGTIYTKALYVPQRDFTEGFPGITDRVEWFGIDFAGRAYISIPGKYRFQLCSDDGSRLYIDGKRVIDNSSHHPFTCEEGAVTLSGGIHKLRIPYFQGPGAALGLVLAIQAPGEKRFRVFNTDQFAPPSNPADWKFGTPEVLEVSPPPETERIKLKDVVEPKEPVVSLAVQVVSAGRPVENLQAADFIIRDEGEAQKITTFGYANQPLDVFLLLDRSPAMEPFLARLKAEAAQSIARLGRADHVGVVLFDDKQLLMLDLASNREILAATLRKSQMGAESKDLNGAVALTAHYLRDHARPEASAAIVILTDNHGTRGFSDRATRDALWQTDVILSGLLLTAPDPPLDADVRPFIKLSGGDMFAADSKSVPLAEAFRSLRDRYHIAYRAPAGTPKAIRRISVELTAEAKARLQEIEIRVRAAYVVAESGKAN